MSGNITTINTETPVIQGVCSTPWATIDKGMYIDLSVYLASVRLQRNVLDTRAVVKSKTNIITDSNFVLPKVNTGEVYSSLSVPVAANNSCTVMNANRPVNITLHTKNGSLDLGKQSLFVYSDSIVSIEFTNTDNIGNIEVNLIIV